MMGQSSRIRTFCLTIGLLGALGARAQSANEPWAGTYRYDGAGNIRAIGNNQYVYDGVGRLRQGTAITAAQHSVQQYTYDAFGNLLIVVTDGDTAHPFAVAVDSATNHADNTTVCPPGSTCFNGAFDESGNQVAYGSTNYSYDSEDMVSGLSSIGRDQLYVYDVDNQRIALVDQPTSANPAWRFTLRDLQQNVVREVVKTGSGGTTAFAWKRDYVRHDGKVLASLTADLSSERRDDFHLDHLGSTRLLTDALGRRTSMHTYWPFGREAAGSDVDDTILKFTGHERDSDGDGNDLDYMHARYYSSTAGRFLAIDPAPGNTQTPGSWNRYVYVRNNPVNASDPDGKDPLGAAVGAYIGAWAGAIVEVHNQGWGWKQPIDYSRVRHAAVGGAIAGGIAGACDCPAGLSAVLNGGGNALGGVVTRKLNGEKTTAKDVVADTVGGVVGGTVGNSIGGKIAAKQVEQQTVKAAALRAEAAAANAGLGADKAAIKAASAAKAAGVQLGGGLANITVGALQTAVTNKLQSPSPPPPPPPPPPDKKPVT